MPGIYPTFSAHGESQLMLIRRLLVFGYPLVEILLLWFVASIVGWLTAILLVIAGLPAGAALIRNSASKFLSARDAEETQRDSIIQSSTGMFLAGLFIMIPGFLTDVLGLLLLIPPIQRRVMSRIGSWTQARMVRTPGFSSYGFSSQAFQGDVIQGIVIQEDYDNQGHRKGEEPYDPSPELPR